MTLSVGHRPRDPDILVMEAWGQGFLVGSLIVMIAITAANMKKGMLLHKLIVAELALALGHGTFTFLHAPAQGWYLSVTAVGLTISHSLHNVIGGPALLGRRYLCQLCLFQSGPGLIYHHSATRAAVPVRCPSAILPTPRVADPDLGTLGGSSPPAFSFRRHAPIHSDLRCVCGGGHLAFVFKCLSDTIILDDFRSALDRLRYHYHPDGVPPQEATHARGRSTNRLVDCVPEASIKRPEPPN
ncbi:hypothetical protein CBS147345_10930 [Aspergillus niger]|nr:hypothetical protein CBS147345_10930 [Aspergillus niger]